MESWARSSATGTRGRRKSGCSIPSTAPGRSSRASRFFGTLIALLREGRPLLGVIDQPVLGERWVGAAGIASRFCGERIETRSCAGIDKALLNTTSPDLFRGADREAFGRLSARVRSTLYGGDCYAYGLLAAGHIDLVVEAGLKTYDYCALVPRRRGRGRAHQRLGRECAPGRIGRPGDRRGRPAGSCPGLGIAVRRHQLGSGDGKPA